MTASTLFAGTAWLIAAMSAGGAPTCLLGERPDYNVQRSADRVRQSDCGLSAGPLVWVQDNVVIMEDDGTLVPGDHGLDIAGRSITLRPAGSGFSATLGSATWVPPSGSPLFQFTDPHATKTLRLALPFAFPFGGQSYSEAWLTSTIAMWFAEPTPSHVLQLEADRVIYDRTPRISPLRSEGVSYGYAAWFEVDPALTPAWARISWATSDLEIQLTLQSNGEIRIDWNRLSDAVPLHGAVEIVSGNDPFWATERLLKSWGDPLGDVSVAGPEGPALDVVAIDLRQLPGTGYTRFAVQLAAPPPTTGGVELDYIFEFYSDSLSTTRTGYEWLYVRNGEIDGSVHAEFHGSLLEVGIPVWRIGVAGSDFHLKLKTYVLDKPAGTAADVAETPGAFFTPGLASRSTDLTSDLPNTTDSPIFEAFTLGTVDTDAIRAAYLATFGATQMDAIATYTNFFTDIYGNGYCRRGNPAVAGIGYDSDPSLPPTPSGLEMGRLEAFYNADPDLRLRLLDHEFGHHFLFFVTIPPANSLSFPLGRVHPAWGVHTPALSDVHFTPDWSVMGGRFWRDNHNGTFTSSPDWWGSSYSALDLYLMGLADRSEVPDWFYLKKYVSAWPGPGQTVTETATPVGIQEIIDTEGPRVPGYPDAPRSFRVPLVLVARPGTSQPVQSQILADYCLAWERNFPRATWTRGTVSCFHDCSPPDSPVGNSLRIAKSQRHGFARMYWTDIVPPPIIYSVLEDTIKSGGFTTVLGSGTPGPAGLEFSLRTISDVHFYRVAGRNDECIGPR